MKKVLKIIGITLLVLVILIVATIAVIAKVASERKTNYYKYTETGGDIEAKYTALGSHEVSYVEYDAKTADYGKYAIWYPSDMKDSNETWPVIVIANGTGATASSYKEVYEHLASWGFVVIGNDDENSRTGASSEETLVFLLDANEDANSEFYKKIDTNHIGIAGHSQGGVAVYNAVTNQEHGSVYTAIYAASATSSYHTPILDEEWGGGWTYDVSGITVPTFMTAGTGLMDAGNCDSKDQIPTDDNGLAQGICPLWSLEENFDTLPDNTTKVIARRVGKDHGDMLHACDGYMTAWFMYWLQGDAKAGKAFLGEEAEIQSNAQWQDVKVNQG